MTISGKEGCTNLIILAKEGLTILIHLTDRCYCAVASSKAILTHGSFVLIYLLGEVVGWHEPCLGQPFTYVTRSSISYI